MKHLLSLRALALAIGLSLAAPFAAEARDHHDHDDHHGHDDHHYSSHGYYRGGYYGGYGFGLGYPYRYGYGYPYDYYYGPRTSITFSSRSYSRPDTYADNLAVDVQRSLARRGYYRGPIDGDIGPGSRSAIRRYQADHRLAVTGRVDRSLLRTLGLD